MKSEIAAPLRLVPKFCVGFEYRSQTMWLEFRIGREKLRTSPYLYLGVSLGTLMLMQLGRALLAMLMGAGLPEAIRFFTTDSLSAVFTLVIIWIVRRLDGVYEDQRHYLRRFHQEQEKERMEGI